VTLAYSYLRLSRKKQTKGHGKDRQWDSAVEACTENNWTLSNKTFQDLGLSAYKGEHLEAGGAFRRFLNLIREGEITKGDILIVENPDRISRQGVRESVSLMLEILNAGVMIYTIFDKKLYRTDVDSNAALMDLMFWGMQAQRAFDESDTKSKRLRSHKEKQRENARNGRTGLIGKVPAWIDTIRPKEGEPYYELNKDRAKVIREIFELKLKGYTPSGIAKHLESQGLPTWSNKVKNWSDYTIRRWLRSPTVYGQLQLMIRDSEGKSVPDGDPIEGFYPAAISKETFVKVQKTITKVVRGRINLNGINLFRGLIKCSCGGSLHVQVVKASGGRQIPYLRCSDAYTTRPCPRPAFDYEQFEYFMGEGLERLNWDELYNHRAGVSQTELAKVTSALDVVNADITEIKVRINNILDSIEQLQGTTITSLTDRLKTNESKLDGLKQNQQELAEHRETLTNQVSASSGIFTSKDDVVPLRSSFRRLQLAINGMDNSDSVKEIRLKMHQKLQQEIERIEISLDLSNNRWRVRVFDIMSSHILDMSINKECTTAWINESSFSGLFEIYRNKIDYRKFRLKSK
jgi:DNA invertase Pin-like site-specific DNA recombinase